MKVFKVETKAQFNPRPGYCEFRAETKADAIKQARRWYNDYCYDRDDGRMTYTVVDSYEEID